MPIIWRALLKQYTKVFALAVTTFVAILFVSRLKQLAQFAAVGAGGSHLLTFALFLIPYILPIAIPISCLIAAILLYQRLSTSHELTAMRACGMGFRQITAPVLMVGAALAIFNFYAASELATHCHLLSRKMEAHTKAINPITLLRNQRFLQTGDLFVDMRTAKSGDAADDVMIVAKDKIVTADHIALVGDELQVDNLAMITRLGDHLFVDSSERATVPVSSFAQALPSGTLRPKNSHLKLRHLLARMKLSPRDAAKGTSEIIRRASLALAALTFTLMGATFGIQISRRPKKRGVLLVILLTAFYIACFSLANGLTEHIWLSAALSLGPQLLIIPFCIWIQRRFTRGIAL